MRHLALDDALELVILYAEKEDTKFERAGCRWLERLLAEQELTLTEAQLAASALGSTARRYRRRCASRTREVSHSS
jgi:hypothetical protein